MFTIWTVLPVSFVTRGKEEKSYNKPARLTFYLEMHSILLVQTEKSLNGLAHPKQSNFCSSL